MTHERRPRITKKFIEEFQPDAVICAVGAHPFVPPIPGIENAQYATEAYKDDLCKDSYMSQRAALLPRMARTVKEATYEGFCAAMDII